MTNEERDVEAVRAVCERLEFRFVDQARGVVARETEVEGVRVILRLRYGSKTSEGLLASQCIAALARPLDVALRIASAHELEPSESNFSFGVEGASLDEGFLRRCDPREVVEVTTRARALIMDPLRGLSAQRHLHVFDDAVVCDPFEQWSSLESTIRRMVALCHALSDMASALPPPVALRAEGIAEAIEREAAHAGLSCTRHPFGVEGTTPDGDALRVRFVTQMDGRHFGDPLRGGESTPGYDVDLAFSEALAGGMILRLPTALERVQSAVGLRDLQAGEPAFDALFLLRATQPDVALAQLGPAARAVLLRLHGLGLRFTLDERGLSGRGELPASAEDAETLLRSLVALRGALRAQTERRIYR